MALENLKDKFFQNTFGGFDCSFEKSKFVLLPVPYDLTTSYKSGTREGPQAIINASINLEFFDAELKKDISKLGIHTLPFLEQITTSPEKMIATVEEVFNQLIEEKKFPVLLGGEHSLTVGSVKSFHKKNPNIAVLQLDAHADLRDEYQGNPYSHACVAQRILDLNIPIRQVGIRSISEDNFEKMQKTPSQSLQTFFAKDIYNSHEWIKEVVDSLPEDVYITIDLDVFDISIMPAVGTPEPGGLDWYLVLKLLTEIVSKKNVIGFDVVELSPIAGNIAPDFLAAKLTYKLLTLIALKKYS